MFILLDQAISSVTNFGASVVAARALDESGFGEFAAGLIMVQLIVTVGRAATAEPLLIRRMGPQANGDARDAIPVVLVVGLVAAVVAGAIGVVSHQSYAVAGVVAPGILLFELLRAAQIAGGGARRAVAMDTGWAILAFGSLLAMRASAPSVVLSLWGGAAALVAVGTVLVAYPDARQGSLRRGVANTGSLGWRLGLEQLLDSGTVLISISVSAVFLSSSALGSFQGARVLFGPLVVVYLGAATVGITEGAHRLATAPATVPRLVRLVSVCVGGACFVAGVALLALPRDVGVAILGDTWDGARLLLPAFTVQNAALGVTQGYRIGLRVLESAGQSLRIRAIVAPFVASAVLVGASFGGAVGAAWGLALSTLAGTWAWRRSFLAVWDDWLASAIPESIQDGGITEQDAVDGSAAPRRRGTGEDGRL